MCVLRAASFWLKSRINRNIDVLEPMRRQALEEAPDEPLFDRRFVAAHEIGDRHPQSGCDASQQNHRSVAFATLELRQITLRKLRRIRRARAVTALDDRGLRGRACPSHAEMPRRRGRRRPARRSVRRLGLRLSCGRSAEYEGRVKYTAIDICVKHFTAYFLLGPHARAVRLTVETSVLAPQWG